MEQAEEVVGQVVVGLDIFGRVRVVVAPVGLSDMVVLVSWSMLGG
ncbi:hypothetical protein I552_6674 [Mycobacterium xenopi 3993]|nr:hypothetical protein I552_6674 [Mycobacterium xenopi 3993]